MKVTPAFIIRDEFTGRIVLTRQEVLNLLHTWDNGPGVVTSVRFKYDGDPLLTLTWRCIAVDAGHPWMLELERGDGGGDVAHVTLDLIAELRTLIANTRGNHG